MAQATLKTATEASPTPGFGFPTMWSAGEGAGVPVGDWSCNVGSIMEVKVAAEPRETVKIVLECPSALVSNEPREINTCRRS